MGCCLEGVSDPVRIVITHPGDSGQQVVNSRVFYSPGVNIHTETSHDYITKIANIARVSINGANTTFQIMHSFYADGEVSIVNKDL